MCLNLINVILIDCGYFDLYCVFCYINLCLVIISRQQLREINIERNNNLLSFSVMIVTIVD